MENLVFIGSEATGYYGGAYDCFGVFVSKEMYEKYREELETAFRYRNHGELDGKHSEVEGNLIVEEVKDELKIVELVYGKQIDYEVYHFSEYAEDYDDEIVKDRKSTRLNSSHVAISYT